MPQMKSSDRHFLGTVVKVRDEDGWSIVQTVTDTPRSRERLAIQRMVGNQEEAARAIARASYERMRAQILADERNGGQQR